METPSKGGKTLPMFTPKNSDGSQRVIKQIMVIDPNKLRVAGLDLKMAEALKKSKGKGGNTISNRTKDDKLALAKTLLNRKLKQAKSSKEAQNQNVEKKCDAPQKLQASVVALQSLLSSPRTYITPSPKQPHTMLVNVLESDQRTGSISNKSLVHQEKAVVEEIPKASIKMTKPIKTKDPTPKTIENVVVSPEVKFEIKKKPLQLSSKAICSEPQSDLPKVIESKVLSPEEKIDMKTLCGNSTKPVPAKVKIEITKQEIIQVKAPAQVEAVMVKDMPKECVIVASAPQLQSEKCPPPSPKSMPKKIEAPLAARKEESAVDFINSLQMNVTTKHETKSKTEPKFKSGGVQEDATSFLMSLFGQQPLSPMLPLEVKKANTGVPELAKRNEPNKQQGSASLDKGSTTQGHRRNPKPVPIIKQKPRFSATTKVVKVTSVTEAVPSNALSHNTTHIEKEPSKVAPSADLPTVESNLKDEKGEIESSQASVERDVPEQVDKTVSSSLSDEKCVKGNKEFLVSEEKSAGLSSTLDSLAETEPESIEIPKLEEVKITSSVSTLDEESSKKSISKEIEQAAVAEDSVKVAVEEISAQCGEKLLTKKLEEDSVNKTSSKDVDTEAVEEKCVKDVDTATPDKVDDNFLKEINSKEADQAVQDVKYSVPVEVEETSAKAVNKVVAEGLSSTGKSAEKSLRDDAKCSRLGTLLAEDASNICKGDASVEIEKVPSDIPVECPKPEMAQQEPVQEKSEIVEKENLQSMVPKGVAAPSAPPPIARRKGKKSVPILIAKLKKSRKPASTQEKPKENITQAPPSDDKTSGKQDECVETRKESEEAAVNSQSPSKADEPTNTLENTVHPKKEDKLEEIDKASGPTNKEKDIITSAQPLEAEVILQEPLHNQCEPVTNKESTPIVETEETVARQKPVKKICSEDTVTPSQSEAESHHNEAQEEIPTKEDAVEIDSQIVTKEVPQRNLCHRTSSTEPPPLITSTEVIEKASQEEIPIETPAESIDHPKPSQIEGKHFTSPKILREEKKSAATTHDTKSPERKKAAEKCQEENITAPHVTEETTCILKDKVSNSVLCVEAKTRPSSRVRKKTLELKEHMNSAPEVATTDVEKAVEDVPDVAKHAFTEYLALSLVESPKKESPKCMAEVKTARSDLHEEMQSSSAKEDNSVSEKKDVVRELSSLDSFDMMRGSQVVKNESSSLPAANRKEKEDESDEFDHCDSDFVASFQDYTEIKVKNSSPHDTATDFETLKSPCEEVNKPVYESKEDLVFLGFNEKEIEEGQQSTSLRLSQSEDVSPLKPSSQSETPNTKKSTPKMKKTPLSVAKKQKAEQKNWKKNSAKSMENWLKSSDKNANVKENDGQTSEMDKQLPREIETQTSVKDKELDREEDSACLSKGIAKSDHAEDKLTSQASTPLRGKKKKGKQDEGVSVAEKKTKPKKPSKVDSKEPTNDLSITVPMVEEHTENQSNTPPSACAVESKPVKKVAASGQRKKGKKGILEEDACATRSNVEEPKSSSKSTKLEEQVLKLESESTEVTTPSKSAIREQKKKSTRGSLAEKPCEGETTPLSNQNLDNSRKTTKRKLETDFEEPSKDVVETKTPVVQKRKYQRRSLKEDAATPTSNATTTKTPKSTRGQKNNKSKKPDVDKELPPSVEPKADVKKSAEDAVTPLNEPKTRKRKAPKCETETPNKVAHITAETDQTVFTPPPRKLDPRDTPETPVTQKSGRKYKHSSEFNPRLLLIRKKGELKSDAPLVDPTLQMVPKSKDDLQCGLCMGYAPKKKWLQHISEHYGIGWVVGSPPPLNINCRSAVLNYMVEFFKTSKVKGLNCRLCQGLRRSALGLLTHIEQCCLTEEELKESRIVCEHCNKEYSKNSLPMHLRSCAELWKKNNAPEPEPPVDVAEKEVVLSNSGRLKRKSVIKAEHKFKDMDSTEISPEELIKHIPQPRKDNVIAAWQRDIKSFGRGFCSEKKCQFTAETVEELQNHCQDGICPYFVQPGYVCTRCKFHSDNMEATRKHVVEKHLSKPTEDFQGSDDDAVISQESSSEGESSGDEEGSEKISADQNAGEKQKSKKKKKSARKRTRNPPKRVQSSKDFRKPVPHQAHGIAKEVARLHQEFIKHNYSENPLFSYAVPNVAQILDDDIEPYFSKSAESPKFILQGFKTAFVEKFGNTRVQPDEWKQLQRLHGMATASEHVMYMGGPVKAIAWVPLSTHTPSPFQYLATVTRKDPNKFARFLKPKQSRSLVCIHRYQINNTGPNRIAGEIHYALAIDDGPIHCIEFLPSGGYDPETNRLGLLAVGTVKSEVKVYSLPLNVQKRDCDMFPILRIEPSFVLALELDENEDDPADIHRSQCVSLVWSQFAGHNHIVAGYVNGFVAIWDIEEDEENLNRFLVSGVRTFVPISYFWSKDDRIRGVAAHYDQNGLRWLVVCNAPRRLVFYDIRDITRPMQIMDERTKNDCIAVDWPVVWSNPAFALGDAMPTHGNCLSSISPTALGFISRKFERFCCGATDLHFNPWSNMYAAGSENGDVQITPLRDTVMEVSSRRKKDDKMLTSLDIVPLNGGELNENITQQASRIFEADHKDKYGIVFGPIRSVTGATTPQLYSPKRVPPLVLTRLTRVHQVRFNLSQKANPFLAVGYLNGLVRVLVDKWEDPSKPQR